MRQYELVEKARGANPLLQEGLLNRAYVYATKMHGGQKRASGDPYFSHPVEVAGILADMNLDEATIITALLHDTIEDTEATAEDIRRLFGPEILRLVEGVTKLSRLPLSSEVDRQASNLRKLLLATADDMRVLLVKLADRLHNMRTLGFIEPESRRRRIAQETLDIYAPLAGRMGMHEFQEELEDLSFVCLNPRAHTAISARLKKTTRDRGGIIRRVEKKLREAFRAEKMPMRVMNRAKMPYAVWLKMEQRQIALEQLSDLIGFRVITDTRINCYRALGIVHSAWQSVPGRFKDYISTPKPNGYQAIHSMLIGPGHERVELQICTEEMHEAAEYGIAAHWRYKEKRYGERGVNGERPGKMKSARGEAERTEAYAWLRRVIEMLEHGGTPEEFLEHTKLEMFRDQLFCFTPEGRVIVLPEGATPIDFAYAIHTNIGNSCVGAKVDGRHVPLRTKLEDGNEVEILRADTSAPSPIWESMVATGKARAAIRRALREQARLEEARLGEDILREAFRRANRRFGLKILERALGPLDRKKTSDLLAEVGRGNLPAHKVLRAVYPNWNAKDAPGLPPRRVVAGGRAVPVRGLTPGMTVHFAPGGFPLPGERIVGIVSPGEGVVIYPIDSPALAAFDDRPECWLDLSWDPNPRRARSFISRLELDIVNEVGALAAVSALIAEYNANIDTLSVIQSDSDCRSLRLDVEVRDVKHINAILTALRGLPAIHDARRVRA